MQASAKPDPAPRHEEQDRWVKKGFARQVSPRRHGFLQGQLIFFTQRWFFKGLRERCCFCFRLRKLSDQDFSVFRPPTTIQTCESAALSSPNGFNVSNQNQNKWFRFLKSLYCRTAASMFQLDLGHFALVNVAIAGKKQGHGWWKVQPEPHQSTNSTTF